MSESDKSYGRGLIRAFPTMETFELTTVPTVEYDRVIFLRMIVKLETTLLVSFDTSP